MTTGPNAIIKRAFSSELRETLSFFRRLRIASIGADNDHLYVREGGPWSIAEINVPPSHVLLPPPSTNGVGSFEEVAAAVAARRTADAEVKHSNGEISCRTPWSAVSYRHRLCRNASPSQFRAASDAVLGLLEYFPPSVMTVSRCQSAKGQAARTGEVFVQRVSLLPLFPGFLPPMLEVLAVDRVVDVQTYDDDDTNTIGSQSSMISVATTEHHDEVGQHTVWLRRLPNTDGRSCDLWLETVSLSKFRSHVPHFFGRTYGRFLQSRAHRLAVQNLRLLVGETGNADKKSMVGNSDEKTVQSLKGLVDLTYARVLVTGAAGFLGTRLIDGLVGAGATVVAMDKKPPPPPPQRSAADSPVEMEKVEWVRGDITSREDIDEAFAVAADRACGSPPGTASEEAKSASKKLFFVVHLAAHWDYELEWNEAYQRTNVDGTVNVLRAAAKHGASRVLFASSLAVFSPRQVGSRTLTEDETLTHPNTVKGAYGRSKALGEQAVSECDCPASVVRFGGIFSDYCELPPLASLVSTWTSNWPVYNQVFPGTLGNTAMPLVHVDDAANLLVLVLDRHDRLSRRAVHVGCASDGSTFDNRRLFEIATRTARQNSNPEPLFVPVSAVCWTLRGARLISNLLSLILPASFAPRPFRVEQPWLIEEHCDAPLYVDASHTREALGWTPRDTDRAVRTMCEAKRENEVRWRRRNEERIAHLL